MVNLITTMVNMEKVGKEILFMEVYFKISLETVWSFHGENMINQITR